jgi:hypothetical protein
MIGFVWNKMVWENSISKLFLSLNNRTTEASIAFVFVNLNTILKQ